MSLCRYGSVQTQWAACVPCGARRIRSDMQTGPLLHERPLLLAADASAAADTPASLKRD
eukprot:CAMPEP_0173381874 /NCGR_PEP_ID=MMETSP1356-20130122/4312_1 /TAXON_ID=77927 ORGANISM="Hemiselmis virescens, Strain PCC157" /NCGR_SAMPLE_ID=MMETSP1356 /ASSEMBLY_ACC=CAM_ASM_000847 /LENGTH=58 /DNA_ID=CAMNT_0014335921 /DNA_START=275 /DNA_END=451 /DNA_ORIENTATION=-